MVFYSLLTQEGTRGLAAALRNSKLKCMICSQPRWKIRVHQTIQVFLCLSVFSSKWPVGRPFLEESVKLWNPWGGEALHIPRWFTACTVLEMLLWKATRWPEVVGARVKEWMTSVHNQAIKEQRERRVYGIRAECLSTIHTWVFDISVKQKMTQAQDVIGNGWCTLCERGCLTEIIKSVSRTKYIGAGEI